ncbi:MAG: hypothetical protein LC676_10965 [Loktanella sp.]|nr:hypothetical protein [Loktanella sp.]
MSRILFLDLARQTGWASGVPGGRIASGSVPLASTQASHGATFAALDALLTEWIEEGGYGVVAFEAPMDPRHMGKMTTFKTTRLLLGLTAIAEATCYRLKVRRTVECSVQDVRKHVIGGQPTRGKAKQEVLQHMIRAGHNPRDDNEADAIAGWLYTEAILAPEKSAERMPMFRRGDA